MSEIAINFEGVSHCYRKGFEALSGIGLSIKKGERIALLGANGSGKTTLLQIAAGLLFPEAGKVEILGKNIDENIFKDPEFNRFFRTKVGLVFQNPDIQLFSPTVFDEICFGPLQLFDDPALVSKRAEEVIKYFRLENLKDRHPYELSQGEKKKVAIAAVLAVDPEILLLDEPTAGLDVRSVTELIDIIEKLHAEGKTVVTSTHDIHTVAELSDRIYVLGENKKIIGQGLAQEVLTDTELLLSANLSHAHRHKHKEIWHAHPHQHADIHEHEHGK